MDNFWTGRVLHSRRDKATFKDEKEKASYALGLNLANGWKKNDVDLDVDAVVRGLKDVFFRRDSKTFRRRNPRHADELQSSHLR